MILTKEQQQWCAEQKLGMGYDDDREDLIQFAHVVETTGSAPFPSDPSKSYEIHEAICRSKRLWFGRGRDYEWTALREDGPVDASAMWANVTCPHCVRILFERGMPGGPHQS